MLIAIRITIWKTMAKHTTPTERQRMEMMFWVLYLSRLRQAVLRWWRIIFFCFF